MGFNLTRKNAYNNYTLIKPLKIIILTNHRLPIDSNICGLRGVNQANQVPYNIVPIFSPVFISFVIFLQQNAVFKHQFHTPPYK